MNKIILTLLLTTVFALSANAQNCVNSSRCDELGYNMSKTDCKGYSTLICPFDKDKVFCVYSPQIYTCEQLSKELAIPNNKVVATGFLDPCSFTMTEGSSLIGIPSLRLEDTYSHEIKMNGKNSLKNIITSYSKTISGRNDLTIEDSVLGTLEGFAEIIFHGENSVQIIRNSSQITSDKLDIASVLHYQLPITIINIPELSFLSELKHNYDIGIMGNQTTQIYSKKITCNALRMVIEYSEIHTDRLYAQEIDCKNSKIYGDLYLNKGDLGEATCEIYGKVFVKNINISNTYAKFKTGSALYFNSAISLSYAPKISFEKDVTIGYQFKDKNGLWKTKKNGTNISLTNIADYAEYLGSFPGVEFPEDYPF